MSHRTDEVAIIQPYEELKMLKSDLPRLRIRDHVKALIISGRLSPDTEIPSTRKLAALWSVDAATVHAALSDLVKERLLIRRHGKGTFVADRIKRLHRVGLYTNLSSFTDPAKWFSRSVLAQLKKKLFERGIDVHVWMDPRSANERKGVWTALESSARNKEIQGLIMVETTSQSLKWAQALPIAISAVTPLNLPFAVNFNAHQFFELGLRALADRGCKNVGLITVHPTGEAYKEYYSELVNMAEAFGLRVRNNWIRIPESPDGITTTELSRFGYRQFHKLWSLRERPDGLLIEPDNVVEGALMAMLQRGVSAPDDIKLVLHRNQSYDYICPFKATQIVTSEESYADALILQIERQVAGEQSAPIRLPFEVIECDGEKIP